MPKETKIKETRMLITPYPVFVHENDTLDDVAMAMIANPRLRTIYVVDDNLKLVGNITLNVLMKQEFKDILPLSSVESFNVLELLGKEVARDIMSKPVYVKDEDTLKTAFLKMYENQQYELPVVDENKKIVGNIDMLELLSMLIEKKEMKNGKKYLTLHCKRPFNKKNIKTT